MISRPHLERQLQCTANPFSLLESAVRVLKLFEDGTLFDYHGREDEIVQAFEALESALDARQQGWITMKHPDGSLLGPAHPRLSDAVLVTVQTGNLSYVAIAAWNGHRWIGLGDDDQLREVRAWMSLPPPAPATR